MFYYVALQVYNDFYMYGNTCPVHFVHVWQKKNSLGFAFLMHFENMMEKTFNEIILNFLFTIIITVLCKYLEDKFLHKI